MARYLIVPAVLVKAGKGLQKNENAFNAVQLVDGRYACDPNASEEFPELFYGRLVSYAELSPADFPIPPQPW